MDLELVKELYNLHTKAFDGVDFNVIHKNNYDIIYSEDINDSYNNFVSNFNVSNKREFKRIINESKDIFNNMNRKTTVCLTPFMGEIYNKREEYFKEDQYELVSTEVWQIYKDLSKINEIKTNCNLNVELEIATDMKKYGDFVMECYKTGDDNDPYGDLDDGYKQGYIKYKQNNYDINSKFYYIKANDEIVGTTQGVYNDKIYAIYSLAIKKEYRNKGIGKEVLKKQLQICKNKNIDIAYLQTEKGFYPHTMYKKIGFKDLCVVYYYLKK